MSVLTHVVINSSLPSEPAAKQSLDQIIWASTALSICLGGVDVPATWFSATDKTSCKIQYIETTSNTLDPSKLPQTRTKQNRI